MIGLRHKPAAKRGQTILELMGVTFVIILLFGLSYYLASVFSVAHQQTMLNRTQAFIELGNYSYYGFSKHGEDKVEEKESRVIFQLGTKSAGAVVNFEKQEDFKQAVEGELELDIYNAAEKEEYWRKFSFPRGITDVRWMGDQESPLFQIRLVSVLAIAHNRSMNSSSGFSAGLADQTGLYSGSIHFNQYSQIAGLTRRLGSGMVDNVDLIKDVLRDLVRNDPSLSDEAAELERSLNVAESITGGAVSSLISLAISAISAWGFEKLAEAKTAAEAAKGAGNAAGGGVAGIDQLTNPINVGTQVGSGNFGRALVDFVTSPVRTFTQGLGNLSAGLAGEGIVTALYGASQIGKVAQMGLSATGQSNQGLNIAVAAFGMPYGVQQGLKAWNSAFDNNPSYLSGSDIAGAVQAIPQIVSPVTNFIVQVAPNSALPISYLNAGMAAASAAVGLPGDIGKLASGSLESLDAIIKVGEITAGVGSLVSNVSYLAGEEDKVGGVLQMAGGSLMAVGFAGKALQELKLEDFKIGDIKIPNPLELAGGILKDNFQGGMEAINQFGKDMAEAGVRIENAWADIFGPKVKVADGGLLPGAKELIDKTTGVFSDDRISKEISNTNLLKTAETLDKLEGNLSLQMAAYGKEDDGTLSARFQEARDAIGVLKELRGGATETAEMRAIINKGAQAIESLNKTVDQTFKTELNNRYLAQQQIRGMMYGNDQLRIAQNLVNNGMTHEQGANIEREYAEKNPFAHMMESTTGGRMSNRLIQDQIDSARALIFQTSEALKVPEDFKGDKAKLQTELRNRAATEIISRAEAISVHGPISTGNVAELKEGAANSALLLKDYLNDPTLKHNDNSRIRIESAIQKLESLSNGTLPVDTGQATIRHIAQQLEEREAKFQHIRSILIACNEGRC